MIHLLYDRTNAKPHLAVALADIMSVLPPEERPALLEEARIAVRSLPPSILEKRAEFLTRLAAFAPEGVRKSLVTEALAAARGIRDEIDNKDCLIDLATLLSPRLGPEAVNAVLTIDTVAFRISALAAVAPHVSDQDLIPGLQKTLADARRIGDESAGEATLVALQPFLSEANNDALPAVPELKPNWALAEGEVPPSRAQKREFVEVFSAVADRVLAEDQAGDLETDGDEQWVGGLLNALRIAQEDPHPRIAAALLAVVRRTELDGRKRALLVEAGPHLLPDEAKQAWSLALGIKEPDNREEALAALIASLPQAE